MKSATSKGLETAIRLGVIACTTSLGVLGCEDDAVSEPSPPPAVAPPDLPDGGPALVTPPGSKSECVAPTKGPTQHKSSISDETWTADASPHILPYDTSVYGTITIEPCAEVLIGGEKTISLFPTGRIIGEGTATKRIHIGPQDTAKPFASIRPHGGATIRLAHATIDGGGARLNTLAYLAGTIDAQGISNADPTQEILHFDHVTVQGSKSNGLVLRDGAGFTAASTALVVKGSAEHPVNMWGRAVGTLPVGEYTGNGKDEILLPGGLSHETIYESQTMHDRGVPYLVGHATSFGELRVEKSPAGGTTVLTIEPGVVLKFKKTTGIMHVAFASSVNPAKAALVAVGTPAKPIVFTSAEAAPAAGDWKGIWFGEVPDATNKIEHARIEYAGGASASGGDSCIVPPEVRNDAAVRIFGKPAGGAFITNTTIVDSATNGIDRGFRSNEKIDFLPTNTFTNVAKCKQSYPRDDNGTCPTAASIPCP